MRRPSRYSPAFREQVIQRACQRGERTLDQVAADLSLNVATLKTWMKHARKASSVPAALADDRPFAERFELLVQSAALQGEASPPSVANTVCSSINSKPGGVSSPRQSFRPMSNSSPAATR